MEGRRGRRDRLCNVESSVTGSRIQQKQLVYMHLRRVESEAWLSSERQGPLEGVIYRSPEQGDKVVDETSPTGPGHETGGRGWGRKGLGRKNETVCTKETRVRGKREGPVKDGRGEHISEIVGLHWNKREASPAPARNMWES